MSTAQRCWQLKAIGRAPADRGFGWLWLLSESELLVLRLLVTLFWQSRFESLRCAQTRILSWNLLAKVLLFLIKQPFPPHQ